MTWILVIILVSKGFTQDDVEIAHMEFNSETACNEMAKAVELGIIGLTYHVNNTTANPIDHKVIICKPKGELSPANQTSTTSLKK